MHIVGNATTNCIYLFILKIYSLTDNLNFRKKLYTSSYHADYVGPLVSLVFLNKWRVHFDIDMQVWLHILVLGVSCGVISDTTLTKMDQMFMGTVLTDDIFDSHYQPWVHRLPNPLWASVIMCSKSQWREVEHTVSLERQHKLGLTSSLDSTDIGLGVLLTAIFLFILEHSGKTLTPQKYYRYHYFWLKECIKGVFDNPVYPTHISALVEAFCNATSKSLDVSTHTCCDFRWDKHKLELRQCYAAAYLLLNPNCRVVPLLEPDACPAFHAYSHHYPLCDWQCILKCIKCQELRQVNKVPHLSTVCNHQENAVVTLNLYVLVRIGIILLTTFE